MANIQDLHDLLKVKADEAIRTDSSSTATRTSFAYGAITSYRTWRCGSIYI